MQGMTRPPTCTDATTQSSSDKHSMPYKEVESAYSGITSGSRIGKVSSAPTLGLTTFQTMRKDRHGLG